MALSGALTAGSIVAAAPVAVTTGSGVGTYANSWGSYTSGGIEGAHYAISPTGKKALSGAVIGGTGAAQVAFVLPSIYRPTATRQFPASVVSGFGTAGPVGNVIIDMSGNVTPQFTGGTSAVALSLDGIEFF